MTPAAARKRKTNPPLTRPEREARAAEELRMAEASVALVLDQYCGRNAKLKRWLETAMHDLDGALREVTPL